MQKKGRELPGCATLLLACLLMSLRPDESQTLVWILIFSLLALSLYLLRYVYFESDPHDKSGVQDR